MSSNADFYSEELLQGANAHLSPVAGLVGQEALWLWL